MEGEVAIIIMTRTGDAGAKTDICCGILERKKKLCGGLRTAELLSEAGLGSSGFLS